MLQQISSSANAAICLRSLILGVFFWLYWALLFIFEPVRHQVKQAAIKIPVVWGNFDDIISLGTFNLGTASTEESIISSKSATLSPPSMFQVPPYNTLNSTPVNANSTLQLPSHPGQNRSPQNDASRSISNDPLQFCSIDSTHCSFYDSFASFSISQHQNGASSFITGANSNHNQFSNVNIGHTNGGYGSGFQNLHHYSSITASRFPLVLENIEMSEQEEGED